RVATRHGSSAGQHDPGDDRHAGPADADEVNTTEPMQGLDLAFVRHDHCRLRRTASWTIATSSTSAFGRPKRAAASLICASRPLSLSKGTTTSWREKVSRSASSM